MLKYFPACIAFLLAFAFLPLHGISQDYPVNLNEVLVKTELTGYYIEKVINATNEDSCIGYVQKGMMNKQVPAILQPDIETGITTLLDRSIRGFDTLKPLIIRINRLYIYELTFSTTEIGCIQLSLTFFTREDSTYIYKFTAGISFDRHSMDVTHLHPENIATAIGICFDDFARRENKGKTSNKPVSKEEVYRNLRPDPEYFPALDLKYSTPGTFRTYYDFRDGYLNPEFPFKIEYLADKPPNVHRATLSHTSTASEKDMWGFSDGSNIYIRLGKFFYKLDKSDSLFKTWIFDRDIKNTEISANISGAAVAGGIIGGVVIGGLVAGIGSIIAGTSRDGENYVIDYSTGTLTYPDPPDYLILQSRSIIYFTGPTDGEEVKVFYNGKMICSVLTGNLLELELPSRYRKIDLTFLLKNGTQITQEVTPRLFFTDTYHVRIKKDNKILFYQVFEEIRKSILAKMTKENTTTLRTL